MVIQLAGDSGGDVSDPMLGGTVGRSTRRHGDGLIVGDHLNDPRLVDDDRILESDVRKYRCVTLGCGCRKRLQENRYRNYFHTVVLVGARIGLGRGRKARLPQMRRRCGGDRDVLTEQSAGPGRRFGGLHKILGADPVLRVMPGRARKNWMRLGWVRQLWGTADVSAVEIAMETYRVITLARQRPDAVMMDGFQRFGDGMRQRGMRTDFDERGVLLGGGGDGLV